MDERRGESVQPGFGSEQDFKRLEKQIKTFMMVQLILIIGQGTIGSIFTS